MAQLHFVEYGPRKAETPQGTLVFIGSIGSTIDMWLPQLDALSDVFRVIAVDHRGHGQSPVIEGLPPLRIWQVTCKKPSKSSALTTTVLSACPWVAPLRSTSRLMIRRSPRQPFCALHRSLALLNPGMSARGPCVQIPPPRLPMPSWAAGSPKAGLLTTQHRPRSTAR